MAPSDDNPYRSPGLSQKTVAMAPGWRREYRSDDVAGPLLPRYRQLEVELRRIRVKHGKGSEEEAPVIYEMVRLWDQLSQAERDMLDLEGPTCDVEAQDVD